MTSLFQYDPAGFRLHSGETSEFRIDCDILSDEEIEVLARMVVRLVPPFTHVEGIPRGGLRLAAALRRYCYSRRDVVWLIVDDVVTTGASLREAMDRKLAEGAERVTGVAIFGRHNFAAPDIRTLFTTPF